METKDSLQFRERLLRSNLNRFIKHLKALPGSIWFKQPLARDFSLCKKAFQRLRGISSKGGCRVHSPQPYERVFNSFTSIQRLADQRGRRLFLKEKRKFEESEML